MQIYRKPVEAVLAANTGVAGAITALSASRRKPLPKGTRRAGEISSLRDSAAQRGWVLSCKNIWHYIEPGLC